MNGHLYLYLLCVGILTALTPWAVVGIIVLLGSRAAGRAAIAFAIGWFCAIAFIAGIVAAGIGEASPSSQETTSNVVFIVELVLGLVLVAFAVRRRARARSAHELASEPGWLTKLDRMSPVVAFAFGTFMINVVFVVDAGMRIAAADLGPSAAIAAIAFYTMLSTGSLIAVLVVYFADREGAEARLRTMRAWIARNNANVITGMLAAVGVYLALKGAVSLY
jgi:Sap, sulfolipid-1-addressing protein